MKKNNPATVRVTHRFNAPAARVFDAWLDPRSERRWLFATPSGEMANVEIDARIGGAFRIVDRRAGEDVAHVGSYVDIDRPRRLVFTLSVPKYTQDVDRVAIDIETLPTGCDLALTHRMSVASTDLAQNVVRGWTDILQALATTLIDELAASPAKARTTCRFDASAERVFDAWLDPEKVRRWFGPNLGEMVRVEVDPKVGGTFSFVQRRGNDDIDHIGVYLEIDRPHRLVFTWGVAPDPPDSRVVIDIVTLPRGCELTLTHEMPAEWAEFAPRSAAAWTKMAAAMAAALA